MMAKKGDEQRQAILQFFASNQNVACNYRSAFHANGTVTSWHLSHTHSSTCCPHECTPDKPARRRRSIAIRDTIRGSRTAWNRYPTTAAYTSYVDLIGSQELVKCCQGVFVPDHQHPQRPRPPPHTQTPRLCLLVDPAPPSNFWFAACRNLCLLAKITKKRKTFAGTYLSEFTLNEYTKNIVNLMLLDCFGQFSRFLKESWRSDSHKMVLAPSQTAVERSKPLTQHEQHSIMPSRKQLLDSG
jgi:hypothetical protein